MMNTEKDFELKIRAQCLAPDIEKEFESFGVNVRVMGQAVQNGRMIFLLKIKRGNRMKQLLACAEDVQRRLKLPLFLVFERKFEVFLVASDQEVMYAHLPKILKYIVNLESIQRMELPCVIGYTPIGEQVYVDLVKSPHILLGGSSNSGKTVGLQALITSIAYITQPSDVSFVLIDVGANGLMPFNSIPHLACPVITERPEACRALSVVIDEMKRRNRLEYARPLEFRRLSRIVLVIDELPELMRVSDKDTASFLVNSVNSLLERGRHAKIHVVLAAQNPIQRNIKVDLSNATARIAFRCLKRNNADTIIENCGAENLPGNGTMYFSFPGYDVQWLQGVNITPAELKRIVTEIRSRWGIAASTDSRFTIPDSALQPKCDSAEMNVPTSDVHNELYVKALYFTLGQDRISAQQLCKQFHIGWPRAAGLIEDFCNWRVISPADAKLPRRVLLHRLEDVPEELLSRLESYGITRNEVQDTIGQRNCEHGFGQ